MSRPLTSLQARVLVVLGDDRHHTREGLRERPGGVCSPHIIAGALVRLGLATVSHHPLHGKRWRITDAGRAALAEMNGDAQ